MYQIRPEFALIIVMTYILSMLKVRSYVSKACFHPKGRYYGGVEIESWDYIKALFPILNTLVAIYYTFIPWKSEHYREKDKGSFFKPVQKYTYKDR